MTKINSIKMHINMYLLFKPLFSFQDESFLEDINMILNTADIPNLYENEDKLSIIEKVLAVT